LPCATVVAARRHLMERKRILFAALIGGIVLTAHQLSAEVICGEELRLKPVRCVCGRLTNATGGPVSSVIVTVLKGGTEVASIKTGQDGKFIFDELKPGIYELNAQAAGYRIFRSSIVVAKPEKKCRHGLAIFLAAGNMESCGSRVIKQ